MISMCCVSRAQKDGDINEVILMDDRRLAFLSDEVFRTDKMGSHLAA